MSNNAPTLIAKTYLWRGDQCYLVSTINRESSAVEAHGLKYAETMVFEIDPTSKKLGDLLGMDEDGRDSIRTHQRIVQSMYETGKCRDDTEES